MAPAFSELLSKAKATKKYLDSMKRCKTKREASLDRCNHLIKLISECNMSANQAGDLVIKVTTISWSVKLKLHKKRIDLIISQIHPRLMNLSVASSPSASDGGNIFQDYRAIVNYIPASFVVISITNCCCWLAISDSRLQQKKLWVSLHC